MHCFGVRGFPIEPKEVLRRKRSISSNVPRRFQRVLLTAANATKPEMPNKVRRAVCPKELQKGCYRMLADAVIFTLVFTPLFIPITGNRSRSTSDSKSEKIVLKKEIHFFFFFHFSALAARQRLRKDILLGSFRVALKPAILAEDVLSDKIDHVLVISCPIPAAWAPWAVIRLLRLQGLRQKPPFTPLPVVRATEAACLYNVFLPDCVMYGSVCTNIGSRLHTHTQCTKKSASPQRAV